MTFIEGTWNRSPQMRPLFGFATVKGSLVMMAMMGLGVFAVAMMAIGAVFWMTLVPALPRIGALLAGDVAAAIPAKLPARRQVMTVRAARLSVAPSALRVAA